MKVIGQCIKVDNYSFKYVVDTIISLNVRNKVFLLVQLSQNKFNLFFK
jgi:hypothetical protein